MTVTSAESRQSARVSAWVLTLLCAASVATILGLARPRPWPGAITPGPSRPPWSIPGGGGSPSFGG